MLRYNSQHGHTKKAVTFILFEKRFLCRKSYDITNNFLKLLLTHCSICTLKYANVGGALSQSLLVIKSS